MSGSTFEKASYLWTQYLSEQATESEYRELAAILRSNPEWIESLMDMELNRPEYLNPQLPDILGGDKARAMLTNILEDTAQQDFPSRKVHFLKTAWFRYAAAIVIIFSIAALFRINDKKNNKPADVVLKTTDIKPGRNGAILTLADGSEVLLDTIQNSAVALQGGAIAKVMNGALQYEQHNISEAVYNSISTPKGRQYHITLPDGSEVWLNAASSIRYPTVFAGKERIVEVTGEAYFEVTKNAAMPFHVHVGNKLEIEVLGTSFNINAYTNETAVRTTLFEGRVKVKKGLSVALLQPGGQAIVNEQIQTMKNVNTGQVLAWKNGIFDFEGASLEEVMRQLERWYDIEVRYEGTVPDIHFGGKLTKGLTLDQLLKLLQLSEVKYRLEKGRQLVVYQ